MRRCGPAPVLICALALGGCAENAVRLDLAKGVSDKSATAMQGVAAYFSEVESRRLSAAAALVASDPSCRPALVVRIQYPMTVQHGARQPLCPATGEAAPGYALSDLDFRPSPEAQLKPRLLLIAAVADYGTALAKIVADPKADISGELTAFAEKIDRVQSLLSLLAGQKLPTAGGVLNSDEGKSLLALASFANELRHEAEQVGRIQVLVKQDGGRVDEALDRLTEIVRDRVSRDMADASRTYAESLSGAYDRERGELGFAERQTLAKAILDARAEQARLPERTAALIAAIAETQAAQQGLRDGLAGKFSKAQRERIARENLDRLTHALQLVAAVGTALV